MLEGSQGNPSAKTILDLSMLELLRSHSKASRQFNDLLKLNDIVLLQNIFKEYERAARKYCIIISGCKIS